MQRNYIKFLAEENNLPRNVVNLTANPLEALVHYTDSIEIVLLTIVREKN